MHLNQFTLSAEQAEAFATELDALERRTREKLGEEDAEYIRRIFKLARNLDLSGRVLLFASFFPPAWLAGTSLLALAKIFDNMEIGHNVMHGQYDFMRDPVLHTKYEWDAVADCDQWRHSHNYVHHTFTNVLGYDHDIGYRAVRTSEEQPWHPKWLLNPSHTFLGAMLFEWGVALHDMNAADAWLEWSPSKLHLEKVAPFLKKAARQVAKDYMLYPMLAGPMALPVLLGNLTANLLRNNWTWAVIFCGHFPEGTAVFTEDELENETRGQWYLRQVLGSANIEGSKLLFLMTGHLSHQIEHHLFPTIPAWRYPEMAEEVRAICTKYGVPYNTGPFARQLGSMLKQVARLSLPVNWDDAIHWRRNAKAMVQAKERGTAFIDGRLRAPSPAVAPRESETSRRLRLAQAFRRAAGSRNTARAGIPRPAAA